MAKKESSAPINRKDQKLFSDFLKEQAKARKQAANDRQNEVDLSQSLLSQEQDILKLLNERKKAAQEYNDYVRTMSDLLKDQTREQKIQAKDLVKEMALKKKRLLDEMKGLDMALKRTKSEKEHNELLAKAVKKADELVENYEDQFESIGKINELIKKMPGGGLLTKILGTDKLQEKIQKQITDQLTNAGAAGQGLAGALGKAAMTLGAFWAIEKFVEWFKEMDEETVKLAKDLDVSRDQAAEIHHEAHGIAEEIAVTGVHTEQVTKAMTELKGVTGLNFGLMAETNKAAKDLVATTALLVEKQGLSTEEAYSLSQAATITGVDMDNLALQAESMGDGLMSGRDIMKEVGKVSKTVLTNFAKNPKELIKAVKQAKLLGTSLDAINDAGSQMLDVESSIENEMKANVLLGKHMNLNAARQAALTGDTGKLMSEIAKQAGSAKEFDDMNVIKKKALADAVGMQVEQLSEMMTKQKELTKLGMTQEELDKSMALTGTERAKKLERIQKLKGKEAAEALKAKYIEQDRVTTTEAFSSAITEATDVMKTTLLPVVQAIAKGLKTFAPVIKPLTIGLASLAAVSLGAMIISKAASGIQAGLSVVKGLGGMFGKGSSVADALKDETSKVANTGKTFTEKSKGVFDGIKSLINGIFDVLKTVADGIFQLGDTIAKGVFKIVDTVLEGLGKAANQLPKIMKALGQAVVAFFEPMQALVNPLVIAGIAIFTGAMIGLGYAFKLLGEGLGAAAPGIQAFFDGIGTVITAVGNAIAKVIASITDSVIRLQNIDGAKLGEVALGIGAISIALGAFGAGGALSGIGGAIGEFFGGDTVEKFKAFESIDASKLNAVAAAITGMGTAIRSFTDALSSVGDISPIINTVDKVMKLHDALTESVGDKILSGIGDAVEGVFSAATDWVASMPGLEGVFGSGGESAAGGGAKKETSLTEVAGLLKELIAKVDQPVKININGRVMDEIEKQTTLRKTYSTKVDSGYGIFG
jgi:plasmid maintenance system antidote protein VapI